MGEKAKADHKKALLIAKLVKGVREKGLKALQRWRS